MNIAVFNSNLTGQANVTLSPDEEALFLEIFSDLDNAMEHQAVQHHLNNIQNQVYKSNPRFNRWTVFRMIWSYATMGHSDFHSLDTVYHAKEAYFTQTGVLADLVKEFNSCRKNGGNQKTAQRVQRGAETLETQSEFPFPGPSSFPSPNTSDNSVATAMTMTANVAPAVQYSVYSSAEAPVDPLTFAHGFPSIPSTFYSSSSAPNPVSYVPSPPDVGSAGVWGGSYDPPPSSGTMYPSLNDVYYMQPTPLNAYSGNQFTDAGPSGPSQYQNDFGGSYGVQDVQLYNNQASYNPGLEQNQEEDHYGDVYELH